MGELGKPKDFFVLTAPQRPPAARLGIFFVVRNKESVQGGPGLADRAGWPPAERAAENPHSRNSTRNSGKLRFFGGFRAGCLDRSASDGLDFASVGLPPLVIQQSGNDLRLRFVCGAL